MRHLTQHVRFRYGKCSKIMNIFLFLFSKKIMVFRAGIHKMDARIANREGPDQTASSGSALFVQAVLASN